MPKRNIFQASMLMLIVVVLSACQLTDSQIGVDEKTVQGFKARTFFNHTGNIEVTIATDGQSHIVALPRGSISRQNQMGDEEYKCLKACKDIADLTSRLNCILLCPVTKNYQVSIF